MNILVCVKQVMDAETVIRVQEGDRWVTADHAPRFQLNNFDEFAIEEAVLIKEARPGTKVDVITVGPPRAAAVLERSLGMGGDNGILVETSEEGCIAPFTLASWIGAYAKDRNYDLIITGVMSEDLMQGQVGPMLAELLGRPYATSVMNIDLHAENGSILVERELEGGRRDLVEMKTPALITVQSGINKPRYPTLSGLLRAKKKEPLRLSAVDLEPPEEREEIIGVFYPEKSRDGLILDGTPAEKAVRLLEILDERSLLRKAGA